MLGVLAEVPTISDQHRFNRDRWAVVLADDALVRLEQRIETDQFGNIVMMPPPGFGHSCLQGKIMDLLRELMDETMGRVLPECPLSTSDGVKGIDVVWLSEDQYRKAEGEDLLTQAPGICVEVISPAITRDELISKKQLYFESGASEVWLCDGKGNLSFYRCDNPDIAEDTSRICPEFPQLIEE